MEKVASKALLPLVCLLEKRGVAVDYYLQQAGISRQVLDDPKGKINWDQFIDFLEMLRDELPDQAQWRSLAHGFASESSYKWARLMMRPLISVESLYRVLTRWIGPMQFPAIKRSLEIRNKGEIETTLELPPHLPMSRVFFWISAGSLEIIPTVLGVEKARVEMVCEEGRAVYTVFYNSETLWVRLWRKLSSSVMTRRRLLAVMDEQGSLADEMQHLRAAYLCQQHDLVQAQRLARVRQTMIGNLEREQLEKRFVAALVADIPELESVAVFGSLASDHRSEAERGSDVSEGKRLSYVMNHGEHVELLLVASAYPVGLLGFIHELLPDLAAALATLPVRTGQEQIAS